MIKSSRNNRIILSMKIAEYLPKNNRAYQLLLYLAIRKALLAIVNDYLWILS